MSAPSAANVFNGTLDVFTEINAECVGDAQQGFQGWCALVSFKIAQAGLRQTGIGRELSQGRALPLAFHGKQIGKTPTDFFMVTEFGHSSA